VIAQGQSAVGDRVQTKPSSPFRRLRGSHGGSAGERGADGSGVRQRYRDTGLRTDITAVGLSYIAGIGPNTLAWPPGVTPLPLHSRTAHGRPRLQRDGQQPVSVKALALTLPTGSRRALRGRECGRRIALGAPERIVAGRIAEGPSEPDQYIGFPPCHKGVAFDRLVDLTKPQWRIECDYQELKQELGLGDYERGG
jgi:hypothetical protein